jgi:hypothetical protein
LSRLSLSRRGLLLLGAGVLTGCTNSNATKPVTTSPGASTPAPSSHRDSRPSSPTPAPTSNVALPRVRPWTPSPGDVEPAAKTQAVRATERLLHRAGVRSEVEVIDAQYGGILADSASVLVVCREYTAAYGKLSSGGTTVDVRLRKSGQTWRVTAMHPAQPGPPAAHLSTAASRVLASHRITLPPASMADVRSGAVHDSVLTAMLRLAENYRIGVSVIRSGHPLYVFGTSRLSDHPRGRAFDTWQIDGHAVVDPATPRALVTGYMRAAAAAGSYNVGGPYRLSGATYFSDATHHDHVHAGFRN